LFSRSVDHRVLHSFPTRRSSDLSETFSGIDHDGVRHPIGRRQEICLAAGWGTLHPLASAVSSQRAVADPASRSSAVGRPNHSTKNRVTTRLGRRPRREMKGSGSRRSAAPGRGATVAEVAVVAPLFVVLVFGVIEIGRLIATYTSVSAAAREGARYAVAVSESPFTPGVPRYADCAGIKEAAKAKSVLVDLDDSDIFIGWDTGPDAPSMFH